MANPFTDKKLHETIQSIFLRPFARRMKYIYTGMHISSDVYVLGNIDEEDYRFVARNQAMGLVQIKDPEIAEKIRNWFSVSDLSLFDRPGILNIVELMTIVKKYKYKIADVPFYTHFDGCIYAEVEASKYTCIYMPFRLFFIFDIYLSAARHYYNVFVYDKGAYADIPLTEAIEQNYKKIVVSKKEMQQYDHLSRLFPGTFKTILLKGLDYIVAKNTDIQNAISYGVRLWHLSGNSLSYGFKYETKNYMCVAARMNAVALLSKHELAQVITKEGSTYDRRNA